VPTRSFSISLRNSRAVVKEILRASRNSVVTHIRGRTGPQVRRQWPAFISRGTQPNRWRAATGHQLGSSCGPVGKHVRTMKPRAICPAGTLLRAPRARTLTATWSRPIPPLPGCNRERGTSSLIWCPGLGPSQSIQDKSSQGPTEVAEERFCGLRLEAGTGGLRSVQPQSADGKFSGLLTWLPQHSRLNSLWACRRPVRQTTWWPCDSNSAATSFPPESFWVDPCIRSKTCSFHDFMSTQRSSGSPKLLRTRAPFSPQKNPKHEAPDDLAHCLQMS
jgi:hypothetical protein